MFFSSFVDVKKKALPLWIREGLEKLEKKKQKQEQEDESDPKKSTVNLSASGPSTIAGYDHGNVHSPVRSPKSNDSDEVSMDNSLHCVQKICMDICLQTLFVLKCRQFCKGKVQGKTHY